MSRRGGSRMSRVDEILREVIADEVARLKDPGLGFVTITGVQTSPDLRSARVFWTVLGDDAQREETAAALQRARPRVRGAAGAQVRMKYLPDLVFEYDESIDRGMRIERLLHDLEEGGDGRPDDGAAHGG